jgi:trehalose synthase-fused probable maltokinase
MGRSSATTAAAAGVPTLHVDGSLRDALAPAALSQLGTEDLARFLTGRRWFGAKGGAPRAVRIASVVPLGWDDGSFAMARLDVETETGDRLQYQLPLAVRDRGAPTAVLANVESADGDGLLFDAVEDAAFRRHLADAFAHGARFESDAAAWVVEPLGTRTLVVPLEAPIELGTAEQSNTSIRFADEGILKLFRRIEPGQNPDVEISGFLTTRANFPYTPALFGIARFEDRDARGSKAETTLSAMLQEFLPESSDAWSHALEVGRRGESFADGARRLGEVTRALHEALASAGAEEPDFVPEPARPSDVEAWAQGTAKQVGDAMTLLERQLGDERLPAELTADARALAARRDELLERVRTLADSVRGDAGLRIRHHGDYHLGQVLRTATGDFMIIDFEGEPARPLAERRRKHSALRDVAGMLRSFAYAGATIAEGGRGRAKGGANAEAWERAAREAFLAGYVQGAGTGSFLPRDRKNVDCLIELFETEKVFYELAYELNNRPDWVWIPMRALKARA